MTEISLDSLVAEGTTQMRGYDDKLVERYAQAMKDGAVFPPVVVFADGSKFYLADGFHRVGAARALKRKTIEAQIHEPINGESPQRSAILYAVGANETHGRNRSADDKRRAVETLLKDPEWSRWTDREITRPCQVAATCVRTLRNALINGGVLEREEKRKAKRNGTTYEVDTKNIGEAKSKPEQKKVAAQVREKREQELKQESEWTAADEHAYKALRREWSRATEAARAKFLAEVGA